MPGNESERLAALRRYRILDTPPDAALDRITHLLATQFDMPIALVSLVDETRQWFKSRYGLDAPETPREVAFCAHAIMGKTPMMVPDARKDARFSNNPLVTDAPNIRFYCGAPLRTSDGHNLGTLCVVDTKPRTLTDSQLGMLEDMATVVVELIELRHAASQVIQRERTSARAAKAQSRERTEELLASEDRFRDITSTIPGVVYQFKIDAQRRPSFPYVGATIKDILGLDPEAVMNDAETWFGIIHADDRVELDVSIRQSRRALSPWHWDVRMTRASGEMGWFRGSSIPRKLEDGSVIWNGLVLDVTEQKMAETALRESESRFKSFIDNAPSAVLMKDTEGRYLLAGKSWHEIFNPTGADISGKTVHDFYPPEHADEVTAIDRQVLASGRAIQTEYRNPDANGDMRTTLLQKFPVRDPAGKIVGIGGINTDITEQKVLEEQLAQAQKMEAVGQLTGGVAHDFNNLLAIIQGNAELLTIKAGIDNEYTDAIRRATARGAELTQRLLAFSRRQPLQPQPVDLAALVAGMIDLMTRTLGETVEISVDAENGLWPALVDAGQVENALLNLAINARDAMPCGGKLTIDCANIDASTAVKGLPRDATGDYVVLTVRDTGNGMSPEVLEHAVEPFFTTKEVGEGSGLGLSMVYGFANQSGGHIVLESEPGAGTTVRLYLPRAETAPVAATAEAAHGDAPQARDETVLVIEDDEDVRTLTVMMLNGLGYRTIGVAEVSEAREVLESGQEIDLLLSDVVLPGGASGPEYAIEAAARYPNLKIIFMSGYPTEAAKDNGLLGSGDVLLTKPFQISELATVVRSALN